MSGLDLGVIGNGRIAALVDREARIVWCCWPRPDGDPVFCGLLRGGGDGFGCFSIAIERPAQSTQAYLPNTAILVTTLTDAGGASLRIIDFMPRFKHYDRIFRPAMLARRIEPVHGAPRLSIRIRPAFDHGATRPERVLGSNHLRFQAPGMALRLTTDAPIAYVEAEAPFVLDAPIHLLLGPDEPLTASLPATMRDFLERTQEYWEEWVRYLSVPFEWQEAVIRAAITLKLCSFEETGAILAALTTSIPEAPDSTRNWDYRFCWLRDAYFVVLALNRLGATLTMEDFIRYITNVAALDPSAPLKPVYSIVPGERLEERVIDSLPGYRGMGPVRVGNQAEAQAQHDSPGSVVLAAAQMFFDHRLPRRADRALFERLERLGERAAAQAFTPDAGPWEFRNRTRIHTYSSAMCWAACDRLAKIAAAIGAPERAAHWREQAIAIRRVVLERAWNQERGSFVESFEGSDVDANLLLLHEIGFVSASDPRFLGTVAAIEHDLKRGNFLLRYAAPDDFGVPTTAFAVCTFWYVDALAAIGRREEARAIFEDVMARRNHLGLLSEDIDPTTGALWGNFPQTFSMVGLIVSAMRLSKSWEEAFWRGS